MNRGKWIIYPEILDLSFEAQLSARAHILLGGWFDRQNIEYVVLILHILRF